MFTKLFATFVICDEYSFRSTDSYETIWKLNKSVFLIQYMKHTCVYISLLHWICLCTLELSRYLCCAHTDRLAIAVTYHVINKVKAVYQFIFSFIRLFLLSSCIRAENYFSWIVHLFLKCTMVIAKTLIYAKRFEGMPKVTDFRLEEETLPELSDGG